MKVIPENTKLDIYVLTVYLNNCYANNTNSCTKYEEVIAFFFQLDIC